MRPLITAAVLIVGTLLGASAYVYKSMTARAERLVTICTIESVRTCLEQAYAAGLEKPQSLEQMQSYIARLPQGITVNGMTVQIACRSGKPVILPTQYAVDLKRGTPVLTPEQQKEYDEMGASSGAGLFPFIVPFMG